MALRVAHPLEGSALRSTRGPRLRRARWERRAASAAVGDAFSRPAPAVGAAMRQTAIVAGLMLVPAALTSGLQTWPIVFLASLALAMHHRCLHPLALARVVVVGLAVHVPPMLGLRAVLHG